MSHKTPKRVALLLGQDLGYSRRVLSGVLGYSESHRLDWIYHNAPPDIRILPALERWRPHGVVVHLADRTLAEGLSRLSVPMISVTNTIEDATIPFVDVDSEAVGRMAAEYFLGRGFRSFAYFGSRRVSFSQNREKGFRTVLEKKGYRVSNFHANFLPYPPLSQDWSRYDRQTERWLKQLPKPVGVLASNDIPGRSLCELCRNAGIRVPEAVAVLGVDNDESECRMSFPTLSSIDIPAEAVGRTAMESLAKLMKGGQPPPAATFLPPVGLIARSSTDWLAPRDPILGKALQIIEEESDRGIGVEAVCESLGVSRRNLERRFRSELGIGVHERIQTVQVARAKRLLLESNLRISEVAERTGFGNLRRFDRVFRQVEGCQPSEYRRLR
ncbi:AraC family transcriptional regulator [Puniceicoccus vermicola]|uniref:AraC family transcriptional regulator n=1 Tax=Puniceicoccus vermicola TaxID=388746 RepID=UPI003390BBDA